MIKIVHSPLLRGWYAVRGAHNTPISGRFVTKAEAEAWVAGKGRNRYQADVKKGPLGSVWCCPCCGKPQFTYKKRPGAGYVGNSVRNAGQAAVTAHIRLEHPDQVSA